MRTVGLLLIGLVAAGGLGGCSGSLSGAKSDAGRDGAAPSDAGARRDEGGANTQDAAADRADGAVCAPLDLPTQCPGGATSECQPTWADALAHPQCMGDPFDHFPFTEETRLDCGAYHVRKVGHTDWGTDYYYDISSGKLVALVRSGGQIDGCNGPPQGVTVDCAGAAVTPVCTLYGGGLSDSDAGLIGDGGVENCLALGDGAISPTPFDWNAPCDRDGGADAGAACYAACDVLNETYKYVGCVSGSAAGTLCRASCSQCP